eukprot:2345170-Pyramimonas_sp.AAC.2
MSHYILPPVPHPKKVKSTAVKTPGSVWLRFRVITTPWVTPKRIRATESPFSGVPPSNGTPYK